MDANRQDRLVSLRASPMRPLAAASLFMAFLLGLAGEAYGLHHDHGHASGAPASASRVGHAHQAMEAEYRLAGTEPEGPVAGPLQVPSEGGGDSEDRSSDSTPEDAPCTCLGICHGASASPLPASPLSPYVRTAEPVAGPRPGDESGPLRAPTPYLLPFGNGPPPA